MKKIVKKYDKVVIFYSVMIILTFMVINRFNKINYVQERNSILHDSKLAVNR